MTTRLPTDIEARLAAAAPGGIFRESYAVCAPIDQYFPVDVNVPGCPPRPQAIIEGVAKAIAIWRQRL